VNISLDVRLEIKLWSKDWYIVINDHVDLLDIDTSGNDVGGDQDLCLGVTEGIEDPISVVRLFISVKRGDRVTFCRESLSDLVGSGLSLLISA
jgi:hypothetical protein